MVPLLIDKNLINFFTIPKEYVFIGLLLFNLFFFATKIVLSKRVSFRRSSLDIPILVFLLISLFSSLFSSNLYDSFLGRSEYFVLNFVLFLFLALFYFLVINTVNTPERWRGIIDTLLVIGGVSSVLFILKAIFKLSLPLVGSVWNVVDGTNSAFGLWLVVIFILAAGLLIKRNLGVGRALFYFFIMILTVVPLLVMGFKVLWWVLLIGLVLLLLLGASFIQEARVGWLSVIFAVLVMSCIFIIFGSPKSLQSVLPVEVSLDYGPSWSITKSAMFSGAKNFILGSGLGTFAYDFSKFRTQDFNYDQVAWSLRFNQPFNSYFAILSEGGLLLFLGFVFVLLFVLGHVFTTWFKTRGSDQGISLSLQMNKMNIRLDVFLVAIAWIVLWVGMAISFFGVPLWTMWWLMLGMIMSGLSLLGHNVVKEKHWTFEDTPQYNLAFSFSLIVVMAVMVLLGVMGVRFYWADNVYASALKSSTFEQAQPKLQEALSLHASSDIFHVAMARAYLMKASQLSQASSPDVQSVASNMASAVNEARASTDLSPNSVAIWENLATMYENATLLVPEAGDWAVKSITTAIALEPTNPVLYWRLGNDYMSSNNIPKAIESYQKAIDLKKDYAGAYVGLSGAYEANKDLDKAIDTYKNILSLGQQNPEIYFNYGRMLYNRNKTDDRSNAEKLWLEAVRIQPGYSNALYSLGLLYEGQGDKAKALEYYYKVKDLNPDNKDIIAKIKALVGGNTAATTATK